MAAPIECTGQRLLPIIIAAAVLASSCSPDRKPVVDSAARAQSARAEAYLLPLMEENAGVFKGKRVLEIGQGSGVLGLHAAKLGAEAVVVSGFDEAALRGATLAARNHDLASVVETRRVPSADSPVYSAVEPGERFDVIVSAPPHSLDLDAPESTGDVDNGHYGPTLVRELDEHLNPEGVAILLYNSLFYHYTIVKFARQLGYDVRDHGPSRMMPLEAEVLYNAYLSRLLEREGIDPAAFRFDASTEKLGCIGAKTPAVALFPGSSSSRSHHGAIVIRGERRPGKRGVVRKPPADPPSGSGGRTSFSSRYFEKPIVLLPGVFPPEEAEGRVLPFMQENAGLFENAHVLDIGTGSGMIGLFAAKLGAAKVVASDIDGMALRNAKMNAESLGVGSVFETRLVPPDDMSAYSVIGPGEKFDVIISNPPYSLDLDAPGNTTETDQGDLGLSIVRGLDDHLNPGGAAVLLYPSIFYHHVMVKYARYEGFDARDHAPLMMTPLEGEALFNNYLSRLLPRVGMEPDAIRFDQLAKPAEMGCFGYRSDPEPLLPGNSERLYSSMIVIRRSSDP